jgi:hypothetical protein
MRASRFQASKVRDAMGDYPYTKNAENTERSARRSPVKLFSQAHHRLGTLPQGWGEGITLRGDGFDLVYCACGCWANAETWIGDLLPRWQGGDFLSQKEVVELVATAAQRDQYTWVIAKRLVILAMRLNSDPEDILDLSTVF